MKHIEKRPRPAGRLAVGSAIALFAHLFAHPGFAQISASVVVDETKVVNTLTRTTIGVYAQVSDASWMNQQVLPQLRVAGIGTVRYPDGWDGQADLYHWSANKAVKWGNSNPPRIATYPASNDFGHFALFADQLGSAMVTVNYGSNPAGTGGGEPMEAAAWVAYANGDPASATVIGVDSTGNDWKTVGYWAAMRAAEPVSPDDGFNFLRINHPRPLNLKLWEIGNEVYNNGWFGGDHAQETDLHAPYPASQKDNEKRRKNPSLSPAYYGARLAEFSKAMKAVDSGILIGASLNLPPNDYTWGEDWDPGVLKAACQEIDFVSLHWHPGVVQPPDWKVMDEASALSAPEDELSRLLRSRRSRGPSCKRPSLARCLPRTPTPCLRRWEPSIRIGFNCTRTA
jgi:alpha-L-arabinofuranosidase